MASPTFVAAGLLGIVNGVSGTGGAISVPVPAGVQAGDLLVTVYVVGDSGKDTSLSAGPPSGWSTPSTSGQDYIKATTSYYSWLAYVSFRTATGSEPANYSFGCPAGQISGGAYGIARMLAFRGGDGTLGAKLAAAYASGSTFTFGAVTPTTSADDWLTIGLDASTSSAPNAPSGFTTAASGGNSSLGMSLQAAYKALTSSASTGTATTSSKGGFSSGSDAPGFAFSLIVDGAAAASSNTVTAGISATPGASGAASQSQPVKGSPSVAPIVAATLAAAMVLQALPSVPPGVQAQVTQSQAVSVAPSVMPAVGGSVSQTQPAAAALSGASGVSATLGQSQSAVAALSVTPGVAGAVQEVGANAVAAALSVTPDVSGAVAQQGPASATLSVKPVARGSIAQSLPMIAGISPLPGVSSTVSQAQPAALSASVVPRVSGVVQEAGVNAVAAGLSVRPCVAVGLTAWQPLIGALSAQTGVSGAAQSVQALSGIVGVTPAVSGAVGSPTMPTAAALSVLPSVSASVTQWQPASVGMSAAPGVTGRVNNGNAYSVEPDFFLSMPARAFYLGMSARSFLLSMPGRCFFIQDEETMAVQTFPAAMDPAETQTLTIDKTADLGANETLAQIVGSPLVTMVRGSDSTPAARFGTPAINLAQITADPPGIPTAIAPGKGIQVKCTQPPDTCWYLFRQPCLTSTGRVVTLKGILQSTAS